MLKKPQVSGCLRFFCGLRGGAAGCVRVFTPAAQPSHSPMAAATIAATSLDDYCREEDIRPDFIKMDIEGAELDAINGAHAVFTQYRPSFAICIYHSLEHRWQVPLRLAGLCPGYDFSVKKSHPVCETVFYGCPR